MSTHAPEPFKLRIRPDARLIAAAPDLLAACKAAQPVLESLALNGWTPESEPLPNSVATEIRNIIRAAIAKAEGK